MASYNNVGSGDAANSSTIQQVIDVLKGTAGAGNIPTSLTAINDSANFALDVKNLDPTNSRTFRAQDSSGGARLQVDITGPQADPTGSGLAPIVNTNATQTLTNKTLTSPTVTGSGFGAWSTFTPTLLQNSSAPGFTIARAAFNQIGKTAFVHIQFSLTSTGAVGTSSAIVVGGIPAAISPVFVGSNISYGTFVYARSGIQIYKGSANFLSTNTLNFLSDSTGGNVTQALGITPSFTVAINDTLGVNLVYETV